MAKITNAIPRIGVHYSLRKDINLTREDATLTLQKDAERFK